LFKSGSSIQKKKKKKKIFLTGLVLQNCWLQLFSSSLILSLSTFLILSFINSNNQKGNKRIRSESITAINTCVFSSFCFKKEQRIPKKKKKKYKQVRYCMYVITHDTRIRIWWKQQSPPKKPNKKEDCKGSAYYTKTLTPEINDPPSPSLSIMPPLKRAPHPF
jgi:hypothetical protein